MRQRLRNEAFIKTYTLPLLVFTAIGLVALSLVFPWGKHISLTVASWLTAFLILSNAKHSPAWRWAGWASLFFAIEESLWVIVRVGGVTTIFNWVDGFTLAGTVAWFVALHRLPMRQFSSRNFILLLPALGLLLWMMWQDYGRIATVEFPLVNAALFLYTIPALESSFRGRASEGRLLLGLGFFTKALAGALFIWLDPVQNATTLFFTLWVVSHTLLGLGAWVELCRPEADIWPTAYALIGLEMVIAMVSVMIFRSGADLSILIPTIMLLAYVLFMGTMTLITSDRNRRLKAESELKAWSRLLEQLLETTVGLSTFGPEQSLGNIMHVVQSHYPHLHGIEVAAQKPIQVGSMDGYAFPIVADGSELGHLYFKKQPKSQHMHTLDALSPLLAARIRSTLSQVNLQTQALTDPLTGLLNRRGFEQKSFHFLQPESHDRKPISVVIFDLDHFKRVNDTHGHPCGDEVLKIFADILKRNTRHNDLVVRWGGEEFVIILHNASLDTSQGIIGRVRQELRETSIPPINWPLTLSAGIAGGDVLNRDLLELIDAADVALLAAKNAGRDRVQIAA